MIHHINAIVDMTTLLLGTRTGQRVGMQAARPTQLVHVRLWCIWEGQRLNLGVRGQAFLRTWRGHF